MLCLIMFSWTKWRGSTVPLLGQTSKWQSTSFPSPSRSHRGSHICWKYFKVTCPIIAGGQFAKSEGYNIEPENCKARSAEWLRNTGQVQVDRIPKGHCNGKDGLQVHMPQSTLGTSWFGRIWISSLFPLLGCRMGYIYCCLTTFSYLVPFSPILMTFH